MIYRFTVITNASVFGASTTLLTNDVTVTRARAAIQAYVTALNNTMYANQSILAVRVGIYGTPRSSVLVIPPTGRIPGDTATLNIPPYGAIALDAESYGPPAIFRCAVQYRVTYNNTYTASRYLPQPPRGVIGTDPSAFAFGSGNPWITDFAKFLTLLENGTYFLVGRSRTGNYAQQSIVGLVQSGADPSLLGVVIAGGGTSAIAQGAKVIVEKTRPPKGVRGPTINGTWIVDSVVTTTTPNITTIFLRSSQAVQPAMVRITAFSRISAYGTQPYAIQDTEILRVVTHKRGRPSIAPRGRRLSLGTLDP